MTETMNKISHLLTFYFYSLSLFISIQNIFARINHHLDTQYCVYVSKQTQCISPSILYNFEPCFQLSFYVGGKMKQMSYRCRHLHFAERTVQRQRSFRPDFQVCSVQILPPDDTNLVTNFHWKPKLKPSLVFMQAAILNSDSIKQI